MNALAVLNIGGESLHPKSRASFLAACKRWGCEFVEFTAPIQPGIHHYWQKTIVIESLQRFDRVLQLDADMLVRANCPNPFDAVPVDSLGLVSAHQCLVDAWINGRNRALRVWSRRLRRPTPPDERHLNGGFLLYDTQHHHDLFRQWQEIGRRWQWSSRHLPEQASLSVLLHKKPIRQTWLPHRWNMVGVQQWQRPETIGPIMRGNIYHFTGSDKNRRITATWWNHAGWREKIHQRTRAILNRLPQHRALSGAEIGVLRGVNAAALLQERPLLTLTLVERWAEHEVDGSYRESGDGNAGWTNDDWRMIQNEALARLAPYHGRYQIVQQDSVRAARLVEDRSLDVVFIDGDHSYRGCKRDIDAWASKVKPGGLLSGHDYGVRNRKWKWGVKKAVDEFARSCHRKVEMGSAFCWFIRMS